MSKKNIKIALTTLALLSATSMQADELLEFTDLGTGEEIRTEILPIADEENEEETPEQRKARLKKEAEQKKKKNGNKSTQGKCGEGTCNT